jgi:hypothetical protein
MTAEARQLTGLVRAVARLALPAQDQLAYLAAIGVSDLADELALDLDDGVQRLAGLGLTPPEIDLIGALDKLLDLMSDSGDDDLWRASGLRTDERWARVRELARDFLFLQD